MIRKIGAKLFGLVFDNIGYKLLALVISIVLWAIIQGEQIQEINRDVIVTINVQEGFGIRGELVRMKAATIRGPQAWLIEVPKKLSAEVIIPAERVGRYRIRLSKDDVKGFNERLELIIHEPYLDLYVDRLVERTVPVKETIHGVPADGFFLEKVSIEPKVVRVRGIRNDLMNLRYVFTEPIDISGIQESRVINTTFVSPGPGSDILGPLSGKVLMQVGSSKINKRFSGIPVEVIGADGAVSLKPRDLDIVVQGVPGVVNILSKEDFSAFVEARGLSRGRYELPIKVKIPPETVLIETIPDRAMIQIGRQ